MFNPWALKTSNCNLQVYVSNFETTFFKSITQSSMFDYGLEVRFFQVKTFCIFHISSINCFENAVISVRYTTLDSGNVLKFIVFPSSVIFFILQKFETFCMLVILTPFRDPLSATSHFNILGFKPENFESNLNFLIV